MAGNILIAYASRYGSTAEVAEAIGKVLREAGAEVEVRRVREVKGLGPYRAVVIGSAARMLKLLPEAVKFAQKHKQALSQMPVAYFTVGLTMIKDTPENRKVAAGFLEPLRQIQEPVSIGLFAGKVDYSRLSFVWRYFFSRAKDFPGEGDYRDWEAIRAWAKELKPLMASAN